MSNDHRPPDPHPQHGVGDKAEDLAESARDKAEQLRRLAEDERTIREQRREALEMAREERERLREAGELARIAGEAARVGTEAHRDAIIKGVHTTAETLQSTLEHMKVVENIRRTIRDMARTHTPDSN
jgi:hypothetical protein